MINQRKILFCLLVFSCMASGMQAAASTSVDYNSNDNQATRIQNFFKETLMSQYSYTYKDQAGQSATGSIPVGSNYFEVIKYLRSTFPEDRVARDKIKIFLDSLWRGAGGGIKLRYYTMNSALCGQKACITPDVLINAVKKIEQEQNAQSQPVSPMRTPTLEPAPVVTVAKNEPTSTSMPAPVMPAPVMPAPVMPAPVMPARVVPARVVPEPIVSGSGILPPVPTSIPKDNYASAKKVHFADEIPVSQEDAVLEFLESMIPDGLRPIKAGDKATGSTIYPHSGATVLDLATTVYMEVLPAQFDLHEILLDDKSNPSNQGRSYEIQKAMFLDLYNALKDKYEQEPELQEKYQYYFGSNATCPDGCVTYPKFMKMVVEKNHVFSSIPNLQQAVPLDTPPLLKQLFDSKIPSSFQFSMKVQAGRPEMMLRVPDTITVLEFCVFFMLYYHGPATHMTFSARNTRERSLSNLVSYEQHGITDFEKSFDKEKLELFYQALEEAYTNDPALDTRNSYFFSTETQDIELPVQEAQFIEYVKKTCLNVERNEMQELKAVLKPYRIEPLSQNIVGPCRKFAPAIANYLLDKDVDIATPDLVLQAVEEMTKAVTGNLDLITQDPRLNFLNGMKLVFNPKALGRPGPGLDYVTGYVQQIIFEMQEEEVVTVDQASLARLHNLLDEEMELGGKLQTVREYLKIKVVHDACAEMPFNLDAIWDAVEQVSNQVFQVLSEEQFHDYGLANELEQTTLRHILFITALRDVESNSACFNKLSAQEQQQARQYQFQGAKEGTV